MGKPERKFSLRAFSHAWHGMTAIWRFEPNCRVHAFFSAAVIFCGFLFKLALLEWAAVLFAIGFVWAMEAMNTAVEHAVDLCTKEYHSEAKIAKDTASAAVLIAAVTSAIIGFLVFIPKLIGWFAA